MKFTMSVKSAIVIIIVLVLIASGLGIWYYQKREISNYEGPVETVTIAAYEGDTGALVYIAENEGFLEKHRLDVSIRNYESGKLAADALLAGEVDISTSADAVLVGYSFTNPDLRVLGTVAVAETNGLVARKDRGITGLEDLKGKKVGVTKKSTGEFNFGVMLTSAGLSMTDMDVVDLQPSEIVDSLISGEIDAGFTWEPNIFNMQKSLGDNAITFKENVDDFYFVILTNDRWLADNEGTAKRFVKALLDAEVFMKENEEKAKRFVKERFDYEDDYLAMTWKCHDYVVTLPQAILLVFENQARWRINNNLTTATSIPNYLNHIYLDALKDVRPEAVTIIS